MFDEIYQDKIINCVPERFRENFHSCSKPFWKQYITIEPCDTVPLTGIGIGIWYQYH